MPGRKRQPAPLHPCRAQGVALRQFKDAYFGEGKTIETLTGEKEAAKDAGDFNKAKRAHPWFAGSPEAKEKLSRSTYALWKKQGSPLDLPNLEVLARVSGKRLTLVIDPVSSNTLGEDEMEWIVEAERLIAQLGALSPMGRGKVLGKLETAILQERASGATSTPQGADVSGGPTHVRGK